MNRDIDNPGSYPLASYSAALFVLYVYNLHIKIITSVKGF